MSNLCPGKSVGGICEDTDGRILMMYRRYEPYGWACPAGHIDEGENAEEALIREYHEETDLEVVDTRDLFQESLPWNNCHRSEGGGHQWWVFKVFCKGEVIISEDETRVDPKTGLRWGWFTKDELQDMELEPVWRYWFEKLGYIKTKTERQV